MEHYAIILAIIIIFVGYKFFFIENIYALGVDLNYPQNSSGIFELIFKSILLSNRVF